MISSFCICILLKYTLNCRLEQLVLDDCHVLVEEFTPQVGEIMKFWEETLGDPDRPRIPFFKPQVKFLFLIILQSLFVVVTPPLPWDGGTA